MTNKNSFLILFILIGLLSCQAKVPKIEEVKKQPTPEVQYPIKIDFENHFKKLQEIKLSEVATKIEYVKLENSTKCFVSRPKSIHVTDSFIFVAQYRSILQFDRQGKFIRKISKMGRGPKEYAHVFAACIHSDKKRVYVNAGEAHKIQVYDFDGKHIAKYKYFSNTDFEILDTLQVVSEITNPYGQEALKLLVTNQKMDTLSQLINTVKFPHQARTFGMFGDFRKPFYRWDGHLNFTPQYGDTVFCIKSLESIKPKYIINKGKYKLPIDCRLEIIQDFRKFKLKADKYIQTVVHEIKDYVLMIYQKSNYEGGIKLAVYDKRSGEIFSVGNADLKKYGFTDDIDGSGNYIYQDIQENRFMVNYFPAITIFDKNVERLENIKIGKENLNYGLKYLEFMKSVKMDDNLIVQIIHLK